MKSLSSKASKVWEWLKAVTGEIMILILVWVILIHGVMVFLTSLVISLVTFGGNIDYAIQVTIWSLIVSSPIVLLLAMVTSLDEDPFLAYLIGGYFGGVIASVLLVVIGFFTSPTPEIAAKYVAGFAFACGLILTAWGQIETWKRRKLAQQ